MFSEGNSLAAQDDARERRLIDLFNLERPENNSRHGVDAVLRIDGMQIEFELKSVTTAKSGLTTVRDFGPDHIEKWRTRHWIVSFHSGEQLLTCKYASPDAMKDWIDQKWEYIRRDFELAKLAPERITLEDMYSVIGEKSEYTLADARSLHKNQYTKTQYNEAMAGMTYISPDAMLKIFKDRLAYVIRRGSTLNNPHVSPSYLNSWPEINSNHAEELRKSVRAWCDAIK